MTTTKDRDPLADLALFLKAAGPYLDRIVLVGGWVPAWIGGVRTFALTPLGPNRTICAQVML